MASNTPRAFFITNIIEEVEFLMSIGYREKDKAPILSGLARAIRKAPLDQWQTWDHMKLSYIIEDLYMMGLKGKVYERRTD